MTCLGFPKKAKNTSVQIWPRFVGWSISTSVDPFICWLVGLSVYAFVNCLVLSSIRQLFHLVIHSYECLFVQLLIHPPNWLAIYKPILHPFVSPHIRPFFFFKAYLNITSVPHLVPQIRSICSICRRFTYNLKAYSIIMTLVSLSVYHAYQ